MQVRQGVVDIIVAVGDGTSGQILLKGQVGEGIHALLTFYQQACTFVNRPQKQGGTASGGAFVVAKGFRKLVGDFSFQLRCVRFHARRTTFVEPERHGLQKGSFFAACQIAVGCQLAGCFTTFGLIPVAREMARAARYS